VAFAWSCALFISQARLTCHEEDLKMIGDLFDSPWKILIVALVIIVLFGSKKLPGAARSLGQSMRILKKEVHGWHEDESEPLPAGAQPAVQAPAGLTAGAASGQPAAEASRPARRPS
jgi:sec-independent protein translocase protein TatA